MPFGSVDVDDGTAPFATIRTGVATDHRWNGVNVERWAVVAEEIRHDKPGQSREKHFAWLCVNEKQLAM